MTEVSLRIRGLTKSFGGVRALDGVDLTVPMGQVHALLGHNGAGKSTLIKCLGGAFPPDAGTIEVGGRAYERLSPRESITAGVAIIFQTLSVVDALTVSENIFLGQEWTRYGRIDRRAQEEVAAGLLERVAATCSPRDRVGELPMGQRQLVEIAKALSRSASVLVLDEPTAALSTAESDALAERVEDLRAQGLAVVYVTHLLAEVERLADAVTVLRDGRVAHHAVGAGQSRRDLVAAIAGRPAEPAGPAVGSRTAGGPVGNRTADVPGGNPTAGGPGDNRTTGVSGVSGVSGGNKTPSVPGGNPTGSGPGGHRPIEVSAGDRPVDEPAGHQPVDAAAEKRSIDVPAGHSLVGAEASARGSDTDTTPRATVSPAAPVARGVGSPDGGLVLEGLRGPGFGPVTLTVGSGERVGLYGLIGSGRTRILETLYGRRRASGGTVRVGGRTVRATRPGDALAAGIALVPADRRRQGLFPTLSARDNALLPAVRPLSRYGVRALGGERRVFDTLAGAVGLRPASPRLPAASFSGGNQQKLVLGRWINDTRDIRALLLDEPTQGVDVGARQEIYRVVRSLADDRGTAVLFASSDPEEIVELADRCLVVAGGRVVGELSGAELTEEALLSAVHDASASPKTSETSTASETSENSETRDVPPAHQQSVTAEGAV